METEVKSYCCEYKDKIILLLSLSGLWPEDSQQPKRSRLIWFGFTIAIEIAFFYAVCNFALINRNKVNAFGSISTFSSFTLVAAKKSMSLAVEFASHFRIGHKVVTMDDVVKAYYNNYKSIMVSFLLVSGMWPDDSKQSRPIRTIRSVLSIIVPMVLVLGVVNLTVHNSHNIMIVVGGSGLIISFGSVCIKMITIMLLWRDVRSLNGGLSAMFESDLKVPENRVHLLAHYRAFYWFFKVYYCSSLGLTILSTSIPILAAFRGRFIRAHAIRVPFPYAPGGTLHWIIFAFEVSATAIMSINSIGIDTVFGLYSLHMVGELRLLAHRFRSLKSGENYKRDLKDCIDRHCSLIDYKYTMDKVFGFTSVLLALSCAIIICSLIYQLTQNKTFSVIQVFFAVDYIAAKFMQAYTYAWFGNTITVESERCVQSIYYSEWAESGDVKTMKDVLIIRSQSPVYINAMGIMIVRLDMFVKIAHASISYFFLIKTIEEKLALAS